MQASFNAGTAIGDNLVGTRIAYSVEALYTDPTGLVKLTPAVATNYVTYR